MTRETKIGLLVGLAFIIVIGILLSDNITRSTEPPQAKLADAGKTAQQAVSTPGTNNNTPPVTVIQPQNMQPQQTVPTNADLNPHPQQTGTSVVSVGAGPGATQQQAPITIVQQDQPKNPTPATPATPTQVATVTPTPTPTAPKHPQTAGADAPDVAPTPAGGIRELARQNGEDLVPVGPGNSATPASATSGKVYKAEAGDTVSRMALKFFGANTKTNRELIIKANPTLHDNPDKVIVGKTYTIPTADAPATPAVASATETPSTPKHSETPASAKPPTDTAAGVENWYTVKQGDSLWRIAKEQCGSASAQAAILDLNKDIIKDANNLQADTKIRLPNRPVASAN